MMPRRLLSIVLLLGILAGCRLAAASASASETFRETYDEGEPTLRFVEDSAEFALRQQSRQSNEKHAGGGAERILGTSGTRGGYVRFAQPAPPAVAIEDLKATLWLRANRARVQIHLRLVFPESRDESGRPLTSLVAGEMYTRPGEWTRLECSASKGAVADAVRRIRHRYPDKTFSDSGHYVDAVVLTAAFGPEPSPLELVVDDLAYGPIVTPKNAVARSEPEAAESTLEPAATFRLGHLKVEGEPFFPLIMPYYAEAEENLKLFASTGVNVAWIPEYQNIQLIDRIREAGLWATAEPPKVRDESGSLLQPGKAGIVPFGRDTRGILFWNFRTRIPVDSLGALIDWVNQIHAADTLLDRPTLADVTGGAYAFSNHIDMLAVSRHITNTSVGYRHYRDWLRKRRADAFVNTFFWTWIQTEPSEQASAARETGGHRPIVIEPSQIRLQVFAALQAGCRGLGFWRTIPFDSEGPGIDERRLALTRLNLELDVLEPILATADAPGTPTRFDVEGQLPGSEGLRVRKRTATVGLGGRKPLQRPFVDATEKPGTADAVLMQTDYGPLMVAAWFGKQSQFCPGRLARNNVTIVVPGVQETAPAWLITPTEIRLLDDRRVAGGKEITLDKFDQTAVVLFTSDTEVVNRFRRVVARHAPRVAEVSVELAQLKRNRVAATHRKLSRVAPPLPDGAAILGRADQFLASAEAALAAGRHHDARMNADNCLQALRILQHSHWLSAVRPLDSPLTSPHTASFSTLPDHYELIADVGRSLQSPASDKSILPSGGFESHEKALNDGWVHVADTGAGISAGADLVAKSPHHGKYALELYADVQSDDARRIDSESAFVTFQSPAVPVEAGTVLHVSGWVNVIEPISAERDGATIHDNVLGLSSGLRWTRTKGWERFEMLREIPADGNYRLTLALHGTGRVQFDDLQIIPHHPATEIASDPAATTAEKN